MAEANEPAGGDNGKPTKTLPHNHQKGCIELGRRLASKATELILQSEMATD